MPGKIKVKILAGRNLPVMDRSGDTTDAYVELKFGNTTYKTDVCRKSLNPQWNSEWYRFEVDDAELQDEPLQIRLMDHDTYSANDAIGKVYINLNPLLLPGTLPPVKNIWTLEATMNTPAGSQGSVMTGWIPVYDTMHGIRGEVNIIIKVELFSDFNKFRQSSCGVQFFYSPNVPYGYHAQMVHGFVEELVVSDDPEYKWIDKIRTPRASNEARQTLFFKLSGEVQRKIGLKALDLGGNAVIGYLQNFDLEGESGIVARGIGTAVTLVKLHDVLPCDNVEEITFALSSYTKTQTECFDTETDGEPLIPSSVPAHITSYPLHISTQLVNKNLPFYSASSASLTYLDRSTAAFETRVKKRKKHVKRIPFFRSATSSTLNLRALNRSGDGSNDFVSSGHLNKTMKSLCSILTSDNRKESSQYRISKQIKHLRDKFDSVSEENRLTAESDHEFGSVSWRAGVNLKKQRNPKEIKTTGKIMAALLIGSIQNMKSLEIVNDIDSVSISPGNEYIEMKDLTRNSKQNLQENTNMTDSDKDKKQQRNTSSSSDEMEHSSFCENDNSTSDDLSDNTANYKILNDSTYSLNKYSDRVEDSSSIQEKISITPSSVESCTDFTQIESDITTNCLSNLNLTSTENDAELRKDAIPMITMGVHESNNSNVSIDAFELSDKGNRRKSVVLASYDAPKIDTRVLTRSTFVDKRDINNVKSLDFFEKCQTNLDTKESNDASSGSDNSFREVHRVHLTRHERDLYRARNQSAQQNGKPIEETRISVERKRTDSAIEASLDSPCTTTDTSMMNEEIRASSERRKCMRDLIKLIDTKMMVSTRATHHVKRTASQTSGRRKLERKMYKVPISGKLPKRFSSRGTSIRRHASHKRRGKEATFRLPNVRLHPNSFSSDQLYSTFSFHATSRSCGSSLVNLSDRISSNSRQAVFSPAFTIDRPSDSGLPRNLKRSSKNNCDKPHAVSAVSIKSSIDSNPTYSCDVTSKVVAVRKCTSVCNLKEASCHIDCTKLSTNMANITYNSCVSRPSPNLRQQDESSISPSYPLPAVSSMAVKMSQSPATKTLANVPLHRRSSDSDLSVTPKGNSLGSSDRSMAGFLRTPAAVVRPMNQDTLEMLEYPFITMQHYPPGFILHIGGLVSSRSVKLLERISNLEEPEGRDAWWTEIRMEVRSHARALACNVVIGYKEETSICDDVCVLSASGTAAVINLHNSGQDSDGVVLNKLQHLQLQQGTSVATVDSDREKSQQKPAMNKLEKVDGDVSLVTHFERQNGKTYRHSSESNDHESGQSQLRCNLCHLPYSENSVPFRVNVSKCAICKRAKVPDVMFTTIEVPANIPTTGRGCFIQATVCKNKKDLRGELNAKEISDCLPFLEYELHSLLLNKLKIKGMNAIFGLRLQVSVGERFIIGMAVGTAVYLTALPPPTIPQIASGNSWHNEEQLAEMQKSIVETVKKNREFYHLSRLVAVNVCNEIENGRMNTSDTDESDEDLPELDLVLGTRDACVLEVDDIEDMDRISSLMDDRPPDDFHVVNTQTIPGLEDLEIVRNLQMFTQVWRAKIPAGQSTSMPSKYLARLLQSLYFKLRRMVPCALCDMQFKVALAEQDEIQLTVIGMALGLGEPLNTDKYKRKIVYRSLSKDQVRKPDDSDMIFSLDEDHVENNAASDNATRICISNPMTLNSVPIQKPRPRSPLRSKIFTTHRRKHVPLKGRYGVDITPLSYLPGGRIERYQGNLNFFFIRESTSIRENGGLSGFTHTFVMEVLAIVRAHITALGGNAMVAFFMTQCVLLHSPHKNQGQCLINVGGDVVTVSYYADEKHSTISNC